MSFGLERPEWLWLLLVLPLAWAMVRRSRRQLSRRRWRTAVVLRTLLLLCAILALAEPTLRRTVDDLAVVFVVDRSASVGAQGEQQALDFVRASLATQQTNDRAAVVVFGADAEVEKGLVDGADIHGFESRVNPHGSDLAAGLRLGTALLPADRTRRVVLLTDGEETTGDAAGQTVLASGDDLQVAVVAIGGHDRPEVVLEDLIAPSAVDEGAAYEVRVVAHADTDATGVLRLYQNDRPAGQMTIELPAGRSQVLSFRQQAGGPGLVRFRAQLEVDPSLDGQPQNNVGIATVEVRGKPKILLVHRNPDQARHLAAVWQGEGLLVDVVGPGELPADLGGLRPYAAIALADIPAYAVPQRTQTALESYVRDLGRGLVMLGGDESFGLGGWYDTPVERALPVRMDISDKARLPKLAMVLALDKSCSMGEGSGSSLGMAEEAAIRTAQLLSDRDSLGLVTFDSAASWVTPLLPLRDRRQAVLDDIASIRPGGGTDAYPAIEAAIGALKKSDAALKHIVLLSDGGTEPADFETLIRGAVKDNVTLTAVAIGQGADQATMQSLANWGGGQYYLVVDKTAIPAIFTREALLATKSFLVEDPFVPTLGMPSDLTRGLDGMTFSTLGGYVTTEAKPRSTVAMLAKDQENTDSLLAHWRYGLGRSVAFTSDAEARWAKSWIGTPSYEKLWTQVGRWLAQSEGSDGVGVVSEIRDGELVVSVDAFDPAGGFRNFLEGAARVVAPDLTVHELPLQQVGPGRYEARLPVDQDGSWLSGIQLSEGGNVVGQAVTEAVQPYSPEYRHRNTGGPLITELGRLGGGGVLKDPGWVFSRPQTPRKVPHPLWPPLVALAAVLLVLDVAARRLELRADRVARPVEVVASAPTASRWTEARARAGAPSSPVGDAATEAPPEEAVEPEVPADSYAGKLLAARRSARDKMRRP